MNDARPVALICGPILNAISGVATHVGLLLDSPLAGEWRLRHFTVGSEGRRETLPGRLGRLAFGPLALAAAVRASRASIVHLNTSLNAKAFWRDISLALAARLCGARVVLQIHGGALPRDFLGAGALVTGVVRHALALADAVVVLASRELAAYREFVPEQRVVLIPNAIDPAPYAAAGHRRDRDGRPLRLVFIGRLHRDKGIYEAIRAVRFAHAHGTALELVVAGDGPELAALERYRGELRLGDAVRFVGPVYGSDKVKVLAAADAFVLPSYGEGLPYALLEAMAAGLPVIATPVGAVPDVVRPGVHGFLVPVGNADAIARAAAELAADADLRARMGNDCRRRVACAYSLERLAGDFSRLYAEVRRAAAAPGRIGPTNAP